MSTSVANAFEYFGEPDTKETQQFIRHFDYFFDCLNVCSPNEWYAKKKESLKPYTAADDSRLQVIMHLVLCLHVSYMFVRTTQWLENDFLHYLGEWESEVNESNQAAQERRKMMLSDETLAGLRITGYYLIFYFTYSFLHVYCLSVFSEIICGNDQISALST